MSSRFRWTLFAGLLSLVLAACGGGGGEPAGDPDVAATANGVVVSTADFDARVNRALRDPEVAERLHANPKVREDLEVQVLSRMIESILLEQAAEDLGVAIPDEEITQRMQEEINGPVGGRARYEEGLRKKGLTDEDVRVEVHQYLLGQAIQEKVRDQIKPADVPARDVTAAYEQLFDGGEPVARHILLQSETQAKRVKAQIDGGAPFAELARKLSKDPSNASAGGLVGEVVPGMFVLEFERAVGRLAVGEVSDPVQTEFGFHIIQRLESPPPHALVDDGLKNQLLKEKRDEAFQDFVAEQRRSATVEINPRFGLWDAETGQISRPEGTTTEPAEQP